jgi:hypothetical protein
MREEKHLKIRYGDLKDILLPKLCGQIFHVTTELSWEQIRAACLKPNTDGGFGFDFGQPKVSFFRRRGCICLFDLRHLDGDGIEEALTKLYFLNPFESDKAVYLFLNKDVSQHLIPWTRWKEEKCYGEMVVPYVEARYPGEIYLADIVGILHVEVTDKPSFFPAWAEAMMQFHNGRQ